MEFGIICSIILVMILVWFGAHGSGAGTHGVIRRLDAAVKFQAAPRESSDNAKQGAVFPCEGIGIPPAISPRHDRRLP